MNCAGCKRELQVGDRFIRFTASEWAVHSGQKPLDGLDDIFASVFGSNDGDNLVYCEGCTVHTDDGWRSETYYGDDE